jgi:hypothetical protein
MKKKYTTEVHDQESGKSWKIEFENSQENTEKANKLSELMDHPWQLITQGGKLGVTGIKRFILIFILFSFVNSVLFIYGLVQFITTGASPNKLVILLVLALLGVGATAYAAYRAYQYAFIDVVRVIYENMSGFFQKICAIIIDKVWAIFQDKTKLNNKQLEKAINIGEIVNEQYKKMPRLLKRGITLVLSKVPVVGTLMTLRNELVEGGKEKASHKLFEKMDGLIGDFFQANNTRWVWWLLPLNIVVMYVVIKLKIG